MSEKMTGSGGAASLQGVRVVEIAGRFGAYAGKLLADLGAEVILVEPPGGAAGRAALPLDERPGAEASLHFSYFNSGKQSVVIDLESQTGRAEFLRLAETAQLVIESMRPGALDARGLGYAALARVAPGLVLCSITPFGATGPYSAYEHEDIVLLALGGLLSLAGFPGSAPTQAYGDQAVLAADQFAAVGAMAALLHAEATGQGQRLDVSAQQCVVMGLENAVQYADLEGTVRKRGGSGRYAGAGIFACQDGEVFVMAAGVGSPRFWKNSVAWLRAEGVDVREIEDDRWYEVAFLATDYAKQTFVRLFTPYAASKTLKYLYHEGQRHGVPIAPMALPADLLANDQLNHRGVFVPLHVPGVHGSASMPGAPYLMSATPVRTGTPPRLGEHTVALLSTEAVRSESRKEWA
jgi:benzylsuccinate CoA-transferase BbsE subunit